MGYSVGRKEDLYRGSGGDRGYGSIGECSRCRQSLPEAGGRYFIPRGGVDYGSSDDREKAGGGGGKGPAFPPLSVHAVPRAA
tara:strand:+ start:169 stop:414 length:246 start_codon:yes stop_codon:yes gene_type:complete